MATFDLNIVHACGRVPRQHLSCLRPRQRIVLMSEIFVYKTEKCRDVSFLLIPIPRQSSTNNKAFQLILYVVCKCKFHVKIFYHHLTFACKETIRTVILTFFKDREI